MQDYTIHEFKIKTTTDITTYFCQLAVIFIGPFFQIFALIF